MISILATAVLLAPPTAAEFVQRSQKAYDAVKTFEQDVTGDIGGTKGTAHVSFARPGRLRVTGDSMFHAKYDLVCDGKSAWVFNGGSWSPVQSPEMGVAMITGLSGNAGTLVPAMLLHTSWGRLDPRTVGSAKATAVTVGGRKLIRVSPIGPSGETVWIDAANSFVVRTETPVMGRKITVVFASPKVDGNLPASRFRR